MYGNRYNQDMEIITDSREQTIAAAQAFAKRLRGGDVVLLYGDLGAGKTTFTKGIALALGVREPVTSPTFTIVKEYKGSALKLYHMDMYRLSGDITELGIEDYIGSEKGVTVIEWCAIGEIRAHIYRVTLAYAGENARKIMIEEEKGERGSK